MKQSVNMGGRENLNNKKNLLINILLVVVLLVFVVGGTYAIAIFSTTSDANTVNTGSISMSYVEPTNALILENALPMSDEEGKNQTKYFEFTVSTHATTNANDNTGITIPYEINISDIGVDEGVTQIRKSLVKVNLSTVDGTSETEVVSPQFISRLLFSNLRDGAMKVYETSDVHKNNSGAKTTTYRLRAWIDEDYAIHNDDETKYQYKFRVNVNSVVKAVGVDYPEETTGTLLAELILGENNSNLVTSGDGLYVSTATNDNNPTYYYRGNIKNNYVSFAGFTWRVIRINEDGTIRLIQQYDADNFIKSSFNVNKKELKYMYYSESNVDGGVMKTLNDWYNTNLATYDSKIATSTYCEAVKFKYSETSNIGNANVPLYTEYVSDFRCPIDDGNGYGLIANQKIGLITMDEILNAGGVIGTTNQFYLSSLMTWTMTPAYFRSNASAWNFYYGGSRPNIALDFEYATLPVISLNSNTLVNATGTGASDNMWVVQ